MKALSYFFWGSAVLVATGATIFYGYVTAMACAFRGDGAQGPCDTPAPWELRGEDLTLLVITPSVIFVGLVVLAVLAGRRAQRSNAT